jgi:hypothetical protein
MHSKATTERRKPRLRAQSWSSMSTCATDMIRADHTRVLGDRLGELGAQMSKRRLELMAPEAGAVAARQARAMPAHTWLLVGGALLAGLWFARRRA